MAWKETYTKNTGAVGVVGAGIPATGGVKLADLDINLMRLAAAKQDGKNVFRVKSSVTSKYAWFRTTGTWSDTARCWGQAVSAGQGMLTTTRMLPSFDNSGWMHFFYDYIDYYYIASDRDRTANRYFMGHGGSHYHSCYQRSSGTTGGTQRCFSGGVEYTSSTAASYAPLADVEVWMLLDEVVGGRAAGYTLTENTYCSPGSYVTESNIDKYVSGSVEQAAQKCNGNSLCRGFTYKDTEGTYQLKNNVTGVVGSSQFTCYEKSSFHVVRPYVG